MFGHLEKLFSRKNKAYGSSYVKFGKICDALFPGGLTLKGEKDFILFGLFVPIIGKCIRIANLLFGKKKKAVSDFRTGKGAKDDIIESVTDSCDDLSIYSQILIK